MANTLVLKTSTTTRTSTTTLSDDPDITVSLTAGKTYRIRGVIGVYAHSTPDMKYRWHYTGTLTWWQCLNHISNTVAQPKTAAAGDSYFPVSSTYLLDGTTTALINGSATSTHRSDILIDAFIKPATDGTFSLQWAQNASNAANVQVLAGSWIWVEDLEVFPTQPFSGKFSVITSDASMSSSTTLADTGLSVVLDANSTYFVDARASWTSGTTEDIKFELNSDVALHTDLTFIAWGHVQSQLDTSQVIASTFVSIVEATAAVGIAGAAGSTYFHVCGSPTNHFGNTWSYGLIKTGANAATLKLRYAQNTSGATTTAVKARSYMIAEKIA